MLAKARIKRSFSEASTTYDNVAVLQRQVGKALSAHINSLPNEATLLDLGCGTGFLADQLLETQFNQIGSIWAVDIALPMLHQARSKLKADHRLNFICADAEKLPFAPSSIDMVMSNLALQWCQHLDDALQDVRQILKPNGQFAFTTFGPLTLHELKSAWKQVDDNAHVNHFMDADTVAESIAKAGFNQFDVSSQSYIYKYESVMDLMIELKQLGAQTVSKGRNSSLTSQNKLNRMINHYQTSQEEELISATFEVITVIAQA